MTIFSDKYGDSNNFTVAMVNAINDLNSGDTLSFSNKEYHFYKDFCQSRVVHMTNTDSFKNPVKYFAILLENLENITINGNGATFVIHGDICSFAMLNCKNVRLQNFSIKYANPQDVELKVVKNKGRVCTFELPTTQFETVGKDTVFFEKSPYDNKNYWQFKNGENTWCSVLHSGANVKRMDHIVSPFSFVKSVKKIGNNQLEITYKKRRKFAVGDIYAYSQNKNRNTCCMFFNECENVVSENIRVMYMQGFGWLSQMCKDMTFNNITFKADDGRVVTSFADLIHVCGCKGLVNISNCYFAHAHDDAINIHGSFLRFKEKVNDSTAIFEFVHNQQGGHKAFFVGDMVRFYHRSNLQQIGDNYLVDSVVDDVDNKTVTVTFTTKLPQLEKKLVVAENVTYCPDVNISDCIFESIPTRGILCTTCGKVRIFNNKFSNLNMAHIFVSNDAADWYESGPVRDMQIFDNDFDLTLPNIKKNSALLVKPITLSRKVKQPIHKNISFFNNRVITGKNKVVIANGVENLNVYDNIITK